MPLTLTGQNSFLARPPTCLIRRSTDQSINDNTLTIVSFDTEITDTDTMYTVGSQPTRITFNTEGFYIVGYSWQFQSGTDYAQALARLRVNGGAGTIDFLGDVRWTGNGAVPANPGSSSSAGYPFVAGDYIELEVFQDNSASAARNLTALPGSILAPSMWAVWQGLG